MKSKHGTCQIDVYDINLQLKFAATFLLFYKTIITIYFLTQNILFSNFDSSWKMRLRNFWVNTEGWCTVTRHSGCPD